MRPMAERWPFRVWTASRTSSSVMGFPAHCSAFFRNSSARASLYRRNFGEGVNSQSIKAVSGTGESGSVFKARAGGAPLRDWAILYRAHYVTRTLEEEFVRRRIPYPIYSGVPFFGRREVKDALDTYINRAVKLRKKNYSAYIGDEFTKVINKLYPEIDTGDLYAFTPDLYKEGIKLYDYKGELMGTYGGSNEH